MSYDTVSAGSREEYGSWGAEAFGGGTLTHQIIGPKGCVGFVRDIMVEVTVAMVGTTTVPEIAVGIASADATFGRYRLGSVVGTGYNTGMHRAGDEALVVNLNNAGRQLADYAGHVVLDGGAYAAAIGTAGGSFSTVAPAGRIPASGMVITNIVNGASNVHRIFLRDPIDPLLKVGQLVQIKPSGASQFGVTGLPTTANAISAISLAQNYIELTGTTFGGTYTAGGFVNVVTVISEVAGTGGSPAGTGHVRVQIDWLGGGQM
jgi:hypothetical protein